MKDVYSHRSIMLLTLHRREIVVTIYSTHSLITITKTHCICTIYIVMSYTIYIVMSYTIYIVMSYTIYKVMSGAGSNPGRHSVINRHIHFHSSAFECPENKT